MNQFIKICMLILICILPLQSLVSVFLVAKIGLPSYVALWKEIVEIIVMICMIWVISRYLIKEKLKLITQIKFISPILVTLLVTLFILLRSYQSVDLKNIIYGFRFELFWVWFLSIFWVYVKSIDTTTRAILFKSIKKFSLYALILCLSISAIILIIGQNTFFSWLGVGSNSILEFNELRSEQFVDGGGWSNLTRVSGTFTTPNHFAAYLLIMISVLISQKKYFEHKWIYYFLIASIIVAIILSFARFAWLILPLFVGFGILTKINLKQLYSKTIAVLLILLPIFISTIALNLPEEFLQKNIPTFIAKPSSTTFHARRTFASLEVFTQNPTVLYTGYGLGSSGPAAKSIYTNLENNRLFKDNLNIALKWILQPNEITIPENWFIQLALNGGVFYAILYTILISYLIILALIRSILEMKYEQINPFLGLYGLLIGNTLLHLWENHTVAIYFSLFVVVTYFSLDKKDKQKLPE